MKKNRDINKLVREMETLFVFWSDQKLPAPPPVPPPARPEDVESRQEAIQFEFPPSYRLFLSLHNGWVGMEKWDVFGVSGMAWDRLHAQYDEDLSYFETQYQKRGGAKYVAKIRAAEKKKNDDVMYLPDHVP